MVVVDLKTQAAVAEAIAELAPEQNRHQVVLQLHPAARVAIDIQGNFHRGLMLGLAGGAFLGILAVAAAALALQALR